VYENRSRSRKKLLRNLQSIYWRRSIELLRASVCLRILSMQLQNRNRPQFMQGLVARSDFCPWLPMITSKATYAVKLSKGCHYFKKQSDRPLLDYIIVGCHSYPSFCEVAPTVDNKPAPNLATIRKLLDNGADPNQFYGEANNLGEAFA
jgi:hypothetical protein